MHIMKNLIIRTALAAGLVFSAAGTVSADEMGDAYGENRICYAYSDTAGTPLPVVDTWRPAIATDINVGALSMSVSGCVPTACPDGYWLLSGNICSAAEPWAESPAREDSLAAQQRQAVVAAEQEALTVEVGPLLPFTPITLAAPTPSVPLQ
jgi:hypothetical protein